MGLLRKRTRRTRTRRTRPVPGDPETHRVIVRDVDPRTGRTKINRAESAEMTALYRSAARRKGREIDAARARARRKSKSKSKRARK